MPHDINGALLNVGDEVVVRCVVKTITNTEEYCNVTVETKEPMHPGDQKTSLTLNAKQVSKA